MSFVQSKNDEYFVEVWALTLCSNEIRLMTFVKCSAFSSSTSMSESLMIRFWRLHNCGWYVEVFLSSVPVILCKLSATWFTNSCQKRDSGTGVFLWILWNFSEHLFYRTPLGDCFYISFDIFLFACYVSMIYVQSISLQSERKAWF